MTLHKDDGDDLVSPLAQGRPEELTRHGIATPEHILRAGFGTS